MASSAKAAAPKSTATKKAAAPAAKKSTAGGNGKSTAGANSGKGAGSNAAVDIQPRLNQQQNAPSPTQRYGTVSQRLPIGLSEPTRRDSVTMLNQLLADTITLRDMYKKHHWQVVGPTFYQLHLLFDKHYEEQAVLVDAIAERIQILGGVAVAMAHDVAELSSIPRVPRDREEAPVQVSRLLDGHQRILKNCHDYADKVDEAGDDGTNDLIVSQLVRTNEMQVWFVAEHVVDSPLTQAE
ncbi:DNA starvation/stationary phase protection protein [Hymenobacter sp. BT770]|uniref:Dps family protein n=1 Tax=Hymenobacter sp. BT770 TaxID=2886942 RepID=UPI001D11FEAF|nr:DNA starvation/stationary phase protection protein [Hymenobacter sp. BT770]MCC3152065.1 DNA starvation/stationary phase protection protein [Hymenobacter sp. BT770]MDO3415252.1 DNA starvation/stationary phase protection protein [Hymenobacter sp. BT770]